MSLGDFGRDMLAEAARIAQQTAARESTHLRWATVTDTDPLRIRYDGEPNPSIVTPQNTVAGLQVGDRVAVGKQHGQALIVGKAGGPPAIARGNHFLQVGDDGAPRLWADPDLVHGRDYSNAGPGVDRNRVMVVTQFGTFGTLAGVLDRDYLPYRIASGRVDITPSAANTPTSRTVTFPAGRFTATPDVLVAPITAVPGSIVLGAGHTGASASSCSVWLTRTNTTSTSVAWVAVQA